MIEIILKDFNKSFTDVFDEVMEILEWCGEHFGTDGFTKINGRWRFVQLSSELIFYFQNEEDAVLFKLTWSK